MNYLTSLRGIAAFMVVLFHIKHFLVNYDLLAVLQPLFAIGYLAVDFFFVLSGFIIAYRYQSHFVSAISAGEVYDFLCKRIARIYPLHVFVLMLFLLVQLLLLIAGRPHDNSVYSFESFLFKLFLMDLWTLNNAHWQSWNVPSWTISGEWFAYIVFPFFVFMMVRLPVFVRAVVLACVVLGLMFSYNANSCSGIGDCIGELGLFRCVGGFVMGVMVYNVRRVAIHWGRAVSVLMLVVAVAALYLNARAGLENYWVIPTMFALALLGVLGFDSVFHRVLNMRPLVYLGDISYSVYLTHAFVADIMYKVLIRNGEQPSLYFLCGYLIVVILFSAISYHWVEVPARKQVYRWLSPRVRKSKSSES